MTTSADDVDSFDNKTSFREALAFANSSPGAATITFHPIVFASTQTITLASTLSVADAVTITGPGANLLTVSGNKAVRVMNVDTPSSGQKVTLTGLTIANGFSTQGGGIFIGDEAVVLQDCAIINNTASGSIGGVYVALGANVVLERCTVSGNSAAAVGAIYSASPLVIRNCTIANNTATTFSAGAIDLRSPGSLVLDNSTVVGNKAAIEGGGIRSSISLTSTGSVISGNTTSGTPDDIFFWITSRVVTATNSAIGSINVAGTISDQGGNILNQPHANLKLGSLADNGGPTQTIALLPGSPLINRGTNPAGLTTDQRGTGFNRVNGGAADIGAFESKLAPTVRNVMINDGSAQRSRVTGVTVEFDSVVNFSGSPVSAFSLKRQADNALPLLSATVSNGATTSVLLTFLSGPAVEFGSLGDGKYTLTIDQSKVSANGAQLDGNVDGVAAGNSTDNYVLVGNPSSAPKLFRLFGDGNGDGTVNSADFAMFRTVFGIAGPIFDHDGNGVVNATDFGEFRRRFGTSIAP